MMPSPAAATTALLARRDGRRGLQSHVLAVVAAAAGAALLLVLTGLWFATGSRAARTDWQTPHAHAGGNVAQVRSVTSVAGLPVVVVDLARIHDDRTVPVPPGLHAFPKQGQVFVSPALRNLLAQTGNQRITGRFGTSITGLIGDSGLAAPDQLLVVIGHRANDPAVSGALGDSASSTASAGSSQAAVVSGFDGTAADPLTVADRNAVMLGVAMIVVPIIVLAAAAGRLGAARREQRLAALRLAGATPRQILAMAGYESLAIGGIGATLGAIVYGATLPLLAHFRLGIGGWFIADLWVGVPVLLAVIAGVALLTALSAMSILSRVVRDPLGVARRDKPGRARMIRIVAAAALIGYIAMSTNDGGLRPPQIAALVILLYGAFWLAGPWLVGRLGALTSRLARRPATLIAGRRLLDDPHGAWRAICGLVLAGFVAGFVSVVGLDIGLDSTRDQVMVPVAGTSQSIPMVTEKAHTALDAAGISGAAVHVAKATDVLASGQPGLIVTVPGGQGRVETAVSALTRLDLGLRPITNADANAPDTVAMTEYATIAVASLLLGFVVAVISTALSAAADVLDRRETYRLLRRAGAPMRLLTRARSIQAALPLVGLAGGTLGCGIYAAQRINHATGSSLDTARVVHLAVCVVVGVAAIMAALASSRPMLARVTGEGIEQHE